MLLLGKETSIGTQMIAEDGLVPVVGGNVGPDQLEHRVGTIPDDEADDLTDQARDRRPKPQAGRDTDAQLIDLNSIFLRSGCAPNL